MVKPLRTLLVEDSEADAQLLLRELRRAYRDVVWKRVETAEAMRAALSDERWDVVVSDFSMPHFSAPAALELLHETGLDLPFIIVSGTVGEDVAVEAMKAGAHDYLLKQNLTRLVPALEREIEQAGQRQARRQAEQKYRTIFENVVVGIFETTLDGRYVLANSTLAHIWGYESPEELMAGVTDLNRQVYVQPGRREEFIRRVEERGAISGFESEAYRRDGSVIWVSEEARGIRDSGGKLVGFEGTTIDITARKLAEEGRDRIAAIIEATPDMVATSDTSGRVLYCNRSGLQMLGFEPGLDPTAIRFLDTYPEWAAKLVRDEGIPHAIRHGMWSGETALLRRDGREVPVSQVIIAHKGTDGAVEYLSTIARDITVRKERERRITRLNRVYAMLSGINTTIVRARDRQELFDEACRIAAELGLFKLVWIGVLDTDGADVTPVARAGVDDGYLDHIQLTARDGAPDRCELVAEALRDKTVVVCNDIDADPRMARWREEARQRGYRAVVVFPLTLHGTVTGLLLFYAGEAGFFDTEEMRLLTEVADDLSFALDYLEADESRQVQSAALNAAANAVVIMDRAAAITWANPAFAALTGFTAAEVIGRNAWDLMKSDKHDQAFYQGVWDTIRAGGVWRGEVASRRKDGSRYTERQSVTPVRSPSGAITHFIAIREDITERLLLQAQLLQAQKMESVGRLAGGIAHDFNNMLSVIFGWTGMMLQELPADHELRPSLDEILKAAEGAATLTKQLLAFSRQQVVEPTLLNVNDVVAGMDQIFRRVIGEDIRLETRTDPELGTVKADHGQLEQVLMNFVVNARDAMPDGGTLTITTGNVVLDADFARQNAGVTPGEYVMLAISDSGVGMDEETKANIFEPFFTMKEQGKGTGLGLATCYGIAKQAEGYIAVDSEKGHGTTMSLYLPRRRETAAPVPRAHSMTPAHGVETILLVEDDAAVRRITTRMLAAQGYRVLSADAGEEALRLLGETRERVDLLLTDVVLAGGMNGRDLADRVRALIPDLKVLFVSGYTSDVTIRRGMRENEVMLVQKPFTAESLGRKIREVLDAR